MFKLGATCTYVAVIYTTLYRVFGNGSFLNISAKPCITVCMYFIVNVFSKTVKYYRYMVTYADTPDQNLKNTEKNTDNFKKY